MIYTAPIESITWQAVEDFLAQRVKEGSTLDYKSNWPDNLERTIAAMANTLGGAVLIGVEEAIDGSPKVPPVGVEFVRGMEERVTNIVLSNITPPLFPAVAVCPNATRDRAVMVIRVPQTGKRFYYTEFSAIGQVFFRQMLTYEGNTQKLLRASEIFARLDQFLRLAKNYLGRLGFQGLVWFNVLMGSLADTTLGTWELNDQVYTSGPCDDEAITFETSLSMADWDSQSKLAMVEAAEKIAWAYDWELPPQQVDAYLSKHRRV